jgi:hypothetical protein
MFAGFYTLSVDPASIPAGYTLVGANTCDVFVSSEDPIANCTFQLQATAPSNPEPEPFVGNSIDGVSYVLTASPSYAANRVILGVLETEVTLDTVYLAEPGRVRFVHATTGEFIGESEVLGVGEHLNLNVGHLDIPWDTNGTALLEVVLVAEDDGAPLADATFSAWGPMIDFALDQEGFATDDVLAPNPYRLTFQRLRGAAAGTNYVVAFSGSTGVLVGYAPFEEPMQWPVALTFLDQPEWDHDAPAQMFCGGFAPPDLCWIDGGNYRFAIMSADAWAQYGDGPGQESDLQSGSPHLLTWSVGGADEFYIYNALGD